MGTVLTLIAGSGEGALPGIAAAIAGAVAARGGPLWLAPGEACDLLLGEADMAAVETLARGVIGAARIDLVVQPAAERRKLLLVADLEGTVIENEMLDELADFLGLRAHVAQITRRAMNGEIDFVAAVEARVALLKGLPETVLGEAAARIRPMPGARALVATMRAHGAATVLVSGGFAVFAQPVAQALGFDRVVANRLEMSGGRIAGTVASPIVTRETKREVLLAAAAERRLPLALTLAVGDGANDLPMLKAAGLGVAFRAKPAVAHRWRLDHADLTGLLYVQGYRKEEIVGAG